MSWLAQVTHVMRKDVDEVRWLLAGYTLLVVGTTIQSALLIGTPSLPIQLLPVLIVLYGMVVVASLVQADSPTSSDAFWPTRPFHASAMAGAKVASALLVVMALALAGQIVVSWASDATAGQIGKNLFLSAKSYSLWLVIAMVVAALTRDLKSFAIALLALALAALFAIPVVLREDAALPRQLIGVVAGAAGIAILTSLYRSRDNARRLWLAAAAVCLGAYVGVTAPMPKAESMPDAAPSLPRAALHAERGSLSASEILLLVTADSAPPNQQLSFAGTRMVIHLRDGTTMPIPLRGRSHDFLGGTTFLGRALRRVGFPSGSRGMVPIAAQLSAEQGRALETGVASITLEGRVRAYEPYATAILPLVEGASTARDGIRLRLRKWSHSGGEAQLTIEALSMAESLPSVGYMDGSSGTSMVLVNEHRGEVIELRRRGVFATTNGMQMVPARGSAWSYGSIELQTLADRVSADDEWFRQAKLVVIARRPLGSYPVTAAVAMQ